MPSQLIYNNIEVEGDLLLALMTPEAISRTWPDLRAAIEKALPPLSNPIESIDRMSNILESLLVGKLHCYAIYKMLEDQPYAFGIVVVSILTSIESDKKNLLIYALYAHPKYVTGDYADKFVNKMKEVARGNDCKAIIAYTTSKMIIDNFVRLGGNADYRLLSMEV